MALISLRGLCEQDEAEYLRLEKFRAYAIGTDEQFRDDSECVRDNLYGGYAPRDNDAFTMHDPFMDDNFGGYYDKPPVNWRGWTNNGHDIHGNPNPSEDIYDGGNSTRLRVLYIPHGGRKLITEVLGKIVAVTFEHCVMPD